MEEKVYSITEIKNRSVKLVCAVGERAFKKYEHYGEIWARVKIHEDLGGNSRLRFELPGKHLGIAIEPVNVFAERVKSVYKAKRRPFLKNGKFSGFPKGFLKTMEFQQISA